MDGLADSRSAYIITNNKKGTTMTASYDNITSKATISLLTLRAWRAKTMHKEETEVENERHGTENVARVIVVLSEHPTLKAVTKLHNEARTEHYKLTLPSSVAGFRLLPLSLEPRHTNAMSKYKVKHDELTNKFIEAYATEKALAPKRMGQLYCPALWPDCVTDKFEFSLKYLPCPSGGTWDDWLEESAEIAIQELRRRLANAIRHMRNKLIDPNSVFRDSLVDNLFELYHLSGDLNITNNQEINEIVSSLNPLIAHAPDILRTSPQTRMSVAEEADKICKKFNL